MNLQNRADSVTRSSPAASRSIYRSAVFRHGPPIIAILVGTTVLLGWTYSIEPLKRVLPGFVAMNPWTAICFVFAALALICKGLPGTYGRGLAISLAAVPLLSGALKLIELVFGIPIGIDAIVFAEKLFDPALNAPSRMAPNTACNFLLLGVALALLNGTSARTIKWSQAFALVVIANSGLALIGYGYSVPSLYGFGAFLPMAVHTASVFILLGVAVLSVHRRHGVVALVIEDGPAGAMARRMLAAAVTVPVGIGWLRLMGEKAGLYPTEMGVALFAFASVMAFSIAVVWAARLLSQSDARRRQSEEALRRERSLVGLLRSLADAANQSSFDNALARTLEVFLQETSAPWGLTIRFGSASKREAEVRWFPRPQGANPDALAEFLIERSRQLAGPLYLDLPPHLGLEALHGHELIPIHDGNDVAGVLFIAGPIADTEERKAARAYAREQLSRSAERHRTHQKLSDALSRHEALFSSVSEGIITINESNTIERFNPAAEAMFGYSFEEIERRDFAILLEEAAEPGGSLANRILAEQGGPKSIAREALGRRKDGTVFPAELSLSVMLLGNRKVFVAFVRDISERKQIERMQAEFVSTVSHELRTPLTSIGGSLGLIVGGAAGDIGDRAKKLIGIAHTNTQRLIRLVNDILDIEKLQSGRMTFQFSTIDLDELVGQVISANVGYAESFGVTVVCTGAPSGAFIQADRDRLNQAITNLVSNAVKFSPPGASVEISATVRDSLIRISVADHGPGIPEEFRSRIFERFAQADSSDTRPKGGSGLGLSIAREIVHRHGGSVLFETELGSGTVFHLDLPRVAPAKHEPLRVTSIDQRQRILVCAHDQSKADAICAALAGQGFGCTVASTAEQAFAAMARATFRASVIDVPFGNIEIAQFVPALREQSGGRRLPVIALSLHDGERPAPEMPYALPIMDWVTNRSELARLPDILRNLAKQSFPDRPRILHVEDDRDVLEVVSHALDGEFTVVPAPSLEQARQHLAREQFQLVILDLTLSDGLGKDLIPALVNAAGAPIPTVVFTAQDGTPELAAKVEAVLTKSRANLTTLLEAVRSVIRHSPERMPEKEAGDEQPQSALRR